MSRPPASARVPVVLAGVALAIGLVLLAFMVTTEGEPGALPLALVLGGATGLVVARRRARRV